MANAVKLSSFISTPHYPVRPLEGVYHQQAGGVSGTGSSLPRARVPYLCPRPSHPFGSALMFRIRLAAVLHMFHSQALSFSKVQTALISLHSNVMLAHAHHNSLHVIHFRFRMWLSYMLLRCFAACALCFTAEQGI